MANSSPENIVSSPKTRFSESAFGQALLDTLPIGLITFDRDLKVLEMNPAAKRLVHPKATVDQILVAGTDEKVWEDWRETIDHCIRSSRPGVFNEVRYTRDNRLRILHITCAPVIIEDGSLAGGALILEDVTAYVEARQQLDQAERLASLGKVSGKVAHELNNPIDGILRYLNLAMRLAQDNRSDKQMEYLQHCRDGLMRMVQVISELLQFSRSGRMSFQLARVDEVITEAAKAMETRTNRINLQIHRHCPEGMPRMRMGNLFQVFCNLIKNSIEAMDGHGELDITVRTQDHILELHFADSGPGIAPEHRESVFEPFFTTKSQRGGSGLGLAICRDIVEKYEGSIRVSNTSEGGTVFIITLPLTADNCIAAEKK